MPYNSGIHKSILTGVFRTLPGMTSSTRYVGHISEVRFEIGVVLARLQTVDPCGHRSVFRRVVEIFAALQHKNRDRKSIRRLQNNRLAFMHVKQNTLPSCVGHVA